MALENRLELKLTQKLILTPQLQQSIRLLQLPQLELSQTLTQELIENPFLEEVTEEQEEATEDSATAIEEELPQEESEDIETPLEKIFGFTTDEYFEERASDGRDLGYFTGGFETTSPLERSSKRPDLYEYLLWQLQFSHCSELLRQTAQTIIGNLNEDGYLQASFEEIARAVEVDNPVVEEALMLVQGLDPPGVGARDLQECLLLQLKPLNLGKSLVEKILTEGFEDLNKKKYKQLSTKFKIPLADILSAVKIIEGLEPRPGRNYSGAETLHITPDVYIEELEGEVVISLNDEGIPKLRLSNYYRRLLSNKNDLSPEEKKFLEEKMRSAIWLVKSLDQRNRTIYRVTESILKFQEDFFRKGIKYLKPLTLRDVANDLGMHESTISRVTSNKYLQCPGGLFSFRTFFSNSAPGQRDVATRSVKETMKEIIEGEDQGSPFTDGEVVEILKSKNINVALRTVAKYREELKIPSHIMRKKWF